MVRLVVLIAVVFSALISGCSVKPPQPESNEFFGTQNESPVQSQQLLLSSLDQGQHHPAVAQLFRQAESQRQLQDIPAALTYVDQARQIQPRNPQIFYRLAWLEYLQGDLEQADQFIKRARVFLRGDELLAQRLNYLMDKIQAKKGR